MLRLVLLLILVIVAATGLDWLAANPGNITIDWLGYRYEPTVFQAIVILALLVGVSIVAWNILRQLWQAPAAIGSVCTRRRQKRGLEALSSGLIALGAGDKSLATRYAIQARKTLPNEPLTHLLRAQAARLAGDHTTSRRIFEAMLSAPDTEQLGLRGLFLEAESEGETEAARQFAERAIRLNAKLGWAVDALFDLQCRQGDWDGALETLAIARRNGHVEKASGDRRRAVLLTAQAQAAEDTDPERALNLATEAHGLAADLVPAAAIAGRLLASRGNTPRATKIIEQTWPKAPHPDLAVAYAYARLGDSPRDRLMRIKRLVALAPMSIESSIAVATAAIEAHDWDEARRSLEPLVDGRLTQRVCTLMARVEGEQHGDRGRVREWLARAVNAPRDPAWTADGVISDTWAPVSPVTGALDAFQWRVPVESVEKRDAEILAQKLEELVALGAPREAIEVDGGVVELSPDDVVVEEAEEIVEPRTTEKPQMAAKPAARADAETVVETVVEPAEPKPVDPPGAAGTAAKSEIHKPGASVAAETPVSAAARVAAVATAGAVAQTIASQTTSSGDPQDRPGAGISAEDAKAAARAAAEKETAEVASYKTGSNKAGSDKTGETAAVSSSAPKTTSTTRGPSGEPKIFVSPRAPDDPGPDDADEAVSKSQGYRTST